MIMKIAGKNAYATHDDNTIINLSQYMRTGDAFPLPMGSGTDFLHGSSFLSRDYSNNAFADFLDYEISIVEKYGVDNYIDTIIHDPSAPDTYISADVSPIYEIFDSHLNDLGLNRYALSYGVDEVDPAIINAIQELAQPYWEMNLMLSTIAEVSFSDDAFDSLAADYHSLGYEAFSNKHGISLGSAPGFLQPVFAESANFLSLSPEDRLAYSLGENREQQFRLALDVGRDHEQSLANSPKTNLSEYLSGDRLASDAWEGFSSFGLNPNFGWNVGYTIQEYSEALVSTYNGFSDEMANQERNGVHEFIGMFDNLTEYETYEEINAIVDPVVRLYTGILGRSPDLEGAEYWVSESNKGVGLEGLASNFLNSSEFQSSVSKPGYEGTIEALYQNVLGRAPDDKGYEYWLDEINSGRTNEAQMALSFTNSSEYIESSTLLVQSSKISLWGVNMSGLDTKELGFQLGEQVSRDTADAIARIYTGVLGRAPDEEGFDYWMDEIRNGRDMVELADSFFHSEEFLGDLESPTNEQAVQALYENVLDRQADGDGYDYWLEKLNSGELSFGEAAISFTNSQEYAAASSARIDSIVDPLYDHGLVGVQVSLNDYLT